MSGRLDIPGNYRAHIGAWGRGMTTAPLVETPRAPACFAGAQHLWGGYVIICSQS